MIEPIERKVVLVVVSTFFVRVGICMCVLVVAYGILFTTPRLVWVGGSFFHRTKTPFVRTDLARVRSGARIAVCISK